MDIRRTLFEIKKDKEGQEWLVVTEVLEKQGFGVDPLRIIGKVKLEPEDGRTFEQTIRPNKTR